MKIRRPERNPFLRITPTELDLSQDLLEERWIVSIS